MEEVTFKGECCRYLRSHATEMVVCGICFMVLTMVNYYSGYRDGYDHGYDVGRRQQAQVQAQAR